MFKVGDRVSVLINNANSAKVKKGDKGVVKKVTSIHCYVSMEKDSQMWVFVHQFLKLVKPKSGHYLTEIFK
jgi:hypothetical protein